MFGVLGLGLLLGMQHALEADHIAAVSSIAARRTNVVEIVKHGATWGLGHTITLFFFSGAALIFGYAIPPSLTQPLETAVGVMLILLGSDVLWRLWRDRIHFHRHQHGSGVDHFHLHSHAGETTMHGVSSHDHKHNIRWRTLAVGLMHGMAGSAALLVLTVSQAPNSRDALLYMLLFGIGSMIGMAALSSVIAIPLVISARMLSWANRVLRLAVGCVAVGIGIMTIYSTAVLPG
ncbi:urease accessory protein [Bradyrhizobium sp. DOA9]|uniref:urease accessory protein n=1 Tax=Bradyrhizobium sp. DOA9 TaxID=1126627 RepID=UPI00046834B7|nr:urease accessory protein [Bradyrhizobium sp. DOA9]